MAGTYCLAPRIAQRSGPLIIVSAAVSRSVMLGWYTHQLCAMREPQRISPPLVLDCFCLRSLLPPLAFFYYHFGFQNDFFHSLRFNI